VILFCGPGVEASAVNRVFRQAPEGETPLMPAALGKTQTRESGQEGWPITRVDRQHPALRPLGDDITFDGVRVKGFHQLVLESGATGTPLLSLDRGPLLVENRTGPGIFMVCTTGASTRWNNLPLQPAFLPLLHQLVYYTGRMENAAVSVDVGSPYGMELTGPTSAVQVQILRPSAEGDRPVRHTIKSDPSGERHLAIYRRTGQPGIYRASYRARGKKQKRRFAVNVPASEGELRTVPLEDLRAKLKQIDASVLDGPGQVADVLRRGRQGWPLWDVLLLAAVALALGEAYVANVWMKR
jgi:hypothetical protein